MVGDPRHPNCIHPLCGCAGTGNCEADPMNTPLPCAITVGHATFGKGVKLCIFVEAARRWHRKAWPEGYELTDEQKAENLRRLQSIPDGAESRKPWEIPGPNQTNPPLPRDLDPSVPRTEGDSTDGVRGSDGGQHG